MISAEWIAKDPISLGKHATGTFTSMTSCQLRNTLYVTTYENPFTGLITHFTWNESGLVSDLRTFETSMIESLVCLKNGQYLIVTYRTLGYDNFTFRFFEEDGSLTKSFMFNDTSLSYLLHIRVFEMPDGNLFVSPKQPSEEGTYIDPIFVLDRNGNILIRQEINFNIPPNASQHNDPLSWTYLKTAVNDENKIIIAAHNADWEKDLSLSETAYFPKRTYVNLSVVNANLTTIVGPLKVYGPKFNNEFDVVVMGTDRFAFVTADRNTSVFNLSIYNIDLQQITADSFKVERGSALFVRPVGTAQNGVVVLATGTNNIYWQNYYYNGSKRGDLVNLKDTYKYLGFVRLKEREDIGILYQRGDTVFFVKGDNFINLANHSRILQLSLIIITICLFILL